MVDMANTKRSTGATGQTVAANLRKLRTSQNLTYSAVSQRLTDVGHQSLPLSIRRMEEEERTVTVDDLMALAVVYGVSPLTLLMPGTEGPDDEVTTTASAEPGPAGRLWDWLTAERPLIGGWREILEFRLHARPQWKQFESELPGDPTMDKIASFNAQVEKLKAQYGED